MHLLFLTTTRVFHCPLLTSLHSHTILYLLVFVAASSDECNFEVSL